MTYGCLGIHQNSTAQRYRIYRLTEYIRHMFTTESPRGNLLILMQLILACKVHILVRFYVFESFPIHARDCWISKRCDRVASFMKSCDFYEMLQLLWKVVTWKGMTFMESCDFYERWRPLWKIVTFPKVCDLSGKAQ